MRARLSVHDMLAPTMAALHPVEPEAIPLGAAAGLVLARPVPAPHALPTRSVALRAGLAVRAADLVGATVHTPVILTELPGSVRPGDVLPDGCDAVLPSEGLDDSGPFHAISIGVAPGESVRLAGHDVEAGAVLADAGTRITSNLSLALALAGIKAVAVRRPRIAMPDLANPDLANPDLADPDLAMPEQDWLARFLRARGCHLENASALGSVDLGLAWSEGAERGLALNPGETAHIDAGASGTPILWLPRRFDAMVAATIALILPLLDRLSARETAMVSRPLARKIVSVVGMSEVVLLKAVPEGYLPLGTGEITLTALAEAGFVALVPPECEGFREGTMLAAIPLSCPCPLPDDINEAAP
ncbi:MAG: molybdopterin binding [Beijerinckiaceae bacterium]|nr:MAG: molybdopterin binding [Beijerinckiaceae bacterium]